MHVSGKGKGIRELDLAKVFSTPAARESLATVQSLDMSYNALTRADSLAPLVALTTLDLSFNAIASIADLPPSLERLFLQGNRLAAALPRAIGRLPRLEVLDVSGNLLTSLHTLSGRMPLRVLLADDNSIAAIGAPRGSGDKSPSASSSDSGSDDDDESNGRTVRSALSRVRTLRMVSLNNNLVGTLDDVGAAFGPLPSLEALSLAGCPVASIRGYRGAVAAIAPRLVTLDGTPIIRGDGDAEEDNDDSNGVIAVELSGGTSEGAGGMIGHTSTHQRHRQKNPSSSAAAKVGSGRQIPAALKQRMANEGGAPLPRRAASAHATPSVPLRSVPPQFAAASSLRRGVLGRNSGPAAQVLAQTATAPMAAPIGGPNTCAVCAAGGDDVGSLRTAVAALRRELRDTLQRYQNERAEAAVLRRQLGTANDQLAAARRVTSEQLDTIAMLRAERDAAVEAARRANAKLLTSDARLRQMSQHSERRGDRAQEEERARLKVRASLEAQYGGGAALKIAERRLAQQQRLLDGERSKGNGNAAQRIGGDASLYAGLNRTAAAANASVYSNRRANSCSAAQHTSLYGARQYHQHQSIHHSHSHHYSDPMGAGMASSQSAGSGGSTEGSDGGGQRSGSADDEEALRMFADGFGAAVVGDAASDEASPDGAAAVSSSSLAAQLKSWMLSEIHNNSAQTN